MACTSPLIHQSVSDGSQTGSTADVGACSDNNIADVENQKNKARFSFSQIHQYLQYGTHPSDFHKSDKLALRKRSNFFKSADGSLYYVGGGKQGICTLIMILQTCTFTKIEVSNSVYCMVMAKFCETNKIKWGSPISWKGP